MKKCTKCNQEKLATREFFPGRKTSKDHLSGWCKTCTNIYKIRMGFVKNYNKKYKHKSLLYGSRRSAKQHGYASLTIPEADLKVFLENHNEECDMPSCQDKAMELDHCHSTGKLRGYLCRAHNNGLGRFSDSITGLQEAIAYLEASRGT